MLRHLCLFPFHILYNFTNSNTNEIFRSLYILVNFIIITIC